jgi:hypothetical protein
VKSNAQKDKRGRDNTKTIMRNHSLEAKGEEKIKWGSSKIRRPAILKPVGSLYGRLINP